MSDFSQSPRQWSNIEVAQLLISRTAMTELSLEDSQKIAKLMHTVSIKAKTVLVQEGTSLNSNYMLLILSGEAVVENVGLKKNDSLILGVVGTGHIVGEMGLLDGEARSATCTAFTDMDVAVLDAQALAKLIETEPVTGCKLLAALLQRTSSRLRATNHKLRMLTQINRAMEQEIISNGTSKASQLPTTTPSDNPLIF